MLLLPPLRPRQTAQDAADVALAAAQTAQDALMAAQVALAAAQMAQMDAEMDRDEAETMVDENMAADMAARANSLVTQRWTLSRPTRANG